MTVKSIVTCIALGVILLSGYVYREDNLKDRKTVTEIQNDIIVPYKCEPIITAEEVAAEVMSNYRPEEHNVPEPNRGNYSRDEHEFIVTAYDLSVESCGKAPGHPGYGVTASGKSLARHTLESARAIAVDPNIIPLGSRVEVAFDDENMKQYDGIYTAVDTGGAIKGNRIDLYVGEDEHELAYSIGVRSARVTCVE
nr:MAG TPA: lytic transglycosylase [Caudoviricetes sp.]